MPINVIIIAVIALILLVVILAITTGKLKIFGKGVASCTARGGDKDCVADTCPPGSVAIPGTDCEPKLCCQKIFEETKK